MMEMVLGEAVHLGEETPPKRWGDSEDRTLRSTVREIAPEMKRFAALGGLNVDCGGWHRKSETKASSLAISRLHRSSPHDAREKGRKHDGLQSFEGFYVYRPLAMLTLMSCRLGLPPVQCHEDILSLLHASSQERQEHVPDAPIDTQHYRSYKESGNRWIVLGASWTQRPHQCG